MAGAGERALCAGGDVAALAGWNKTGKEGQARSADYFGLEYQLDHLIATYTKPYIAYMDGITMGGGVGLSVHAPFRIATERTRFAMPETSIGFFPDVGGSFFLPRMDGHVGKYLALTSEELKGVNAFYAGIATHYIHSSSLGDLTARLSELVFKDYSTFQERLAIIDTTIHEFNTGLPHDQPIQIAGERRAAIDRCFHHQTIEPVFKALEREASAQLPTSDWAKETLQTLSKRSPTSLKVVMSQMNFGQRWDIAETFRREHQLAARFMATHDFTEGVTAVLVERRPATWQPSTLEAVTAKSIEKMFITQGEQLLLYSEGTYKDYPHAWLGLPREEDVRRRVLQGDLQSGEDVVAWFVMDRGEKVGTREKVEEVVRRKVVPVGEGEERGVRWRVEEWEKS